MRTQMIASVGALLVATACFSAGVTSAASKSRPSHNEEAPVPAETVLCVIDESDATTMPTRPRRRQSISARASLRPDSLAARLHRAKAVDTAADAPGETPPEPKSDQLMLSRHEQPDNSRIVRIAVEESTTPLAAKFAPASESNDEKPSRVVLASGQDISTQATVIEGHKTTLPTPSRWLLNLGSLLKIR